MTRTTFDITRIKSLYDPDPERLRLARQRQAAVWRRETPDQWPILLSDHLTPAQEEIPAPDLPEAFADREMMLCQQIRTAAAVANSRSDAVPCIRANTGTATLLACLGLEQQISAGQMPWLQEHYSVEEAAGLTVDDIEFKGKFAWALEFISFTREVMGDTIDIFCVDTQGPFDLAHLLLGDQVFYLMHDDPGLMHQILELCTQLYIRCTRAVKEATGEPMCSSVHSGRLYVPNAGVRICEDTTTLIGEDAIREFALPYTLRCAREFGGAWVHYCGRCDILRDILCEHEEIRGLNYGIVPSKEDDFDFDNEMDVIAGHGKSYFGGIPRKRGESGKEYLKRLHAYAQKGGLLPIADAAVGRESGFQNAAQALDFWYSL